MYRMASIESAEFTAIPTFLPSQVEQSEPIESLWHSSPFHACRMSPTVVKRKLEARDADTKQRLTQDCAQTTASKTI